MSLAPEIPLIFAVTSRDQEDPEQLFIGQGRDAPGLRNLVLVIEVEDSGDQLGIDREVILPAVCTVEDYRAELLGGNHLVLERQLADARPGRRVQTVEHAGVLDRFRTAVNDIQILAGPR